MKRALPWCRLYSDFLHNSKMLSLSFENQRHFFAILALKAGAVIDQDCEPELMDSIVARSIWVAPNDIQDVKAALIKAGLVDERWQPIGWGSRQQRSDHDSTGAARQKRYRENNSNALRNADSNAPIKNTVTQPEESREDKSRSNVPKGTSSLLPDGQQATFTTMPCPHQEILALYHEVLPDLPSVREWTKARAKLMQARWNENLKKGHYSDKEGGLNFWRRYFTFVAESDFLCGRADPAKGKPPFLADLEWLIKPSNFAKVVEGKYHRNGAA